MSAHLLAGLGRIPAQAAPPSRRPALVVDVEMSAPVKVIDARADDGARYRSAWIVARVFGEVVGLLPVDFIDDTLSVDQIVQAVDRHCGSFVRDRIRQAGGDDGTAMAGRGCAWSGTPEFLQRHARIDLQGPEITVAICTRNRPQDVRRAIDSVSSQSYRRFSVLVVDNAPDTDETEQVVRGIAEFDDRISYTVEARPGLSWARNHALARIGSAVVAWLDDDEIADEHWLMEIAGGFCEGAAVEAVSGSVIPAELETDAQMWFEMFGGHSKGRGFTPDVFGGPADRRQSPLYPLPPFGVGANMAFHVETLRGVGGFDTALGAGTATLGGEDTLAFTQILLRGGRIAYRPSALTRHFHRPEYSSLTRQMRGYGIGLTAYYTALLRSNWRLIFPMLKLIPRAFTDSFSARGQGMAGVPASFPRELLHVKIRGMLAGPVAYARARRQSRRLAGGPA